MNWLNIPIALMRSPEYIGSEPTERATWLNLLAYCVEQENGGCIIGCDEWKDRQWQQTCGVTLLEVAATSDLWKWQENTLIIWGYPSEKQAQVQAKRQAGAAGGKSKTQAKTQASRTNGAKHQPKQKPKHHAPTEPSKNPTEEKRIEEKGIEKEEEEAAAAAAAPTDVALQITIDKIFAAYPRRTHHTESYNHIYHAIKHGADPQEILAGTQRIAAVVATWTEAEKLKYIPTAPAFFAGGRWKDDPTYWKSRQTTNLTTPPDHNPLLGGRKIATTITVPTQPELIP